MSDGNHKLTIVYAGDSINAGLVKSILEGSGIKSFLRDEFIGTMAPYIAAGGGAGAVKVMVDEKDVEREKDIVKEFMH